MNRNTFIPLLSPLVVPPGAKQNYLQNEIVSPCSSESGQGFAHAIAAGRGFPFAVLAFLFVKDLKEEARREWPSEEPPLPIECLHVPRRSSWPAPRLDAFDNTCSFSVSAIVRI